MTNEEARALKEKKAVAYKKTFFTELGKAVLDDLRKKFDHDTFHENPVVMAQLSGQRQVYLYIQRILQSDLGE